MVDYGAKNHRKLTKIKLGQKGMIFLNPVPLNCIVSW